MIMTLGMVGFVTTTDAATVEICVPAPTGDPLIDWTNIQDALDSMSPGDTLCLAAGRYTIHRPLVTHGFHGSIIGAGMDETFIEAVRGPLGYFEAAYMTEYDGWGNLPRPGSEDYYTAFFYFGGPDTSVDVSDLTLEVNEPDVAELSYTYYPAYDEVILGGKLTVHHPELYDYWWYNENNIHCGIDISQSFDCDTSFENIRITGLYTYIPATEETWDDSICSPRFGLVHWWSSGGSHIVKDCVFEGSGVFACGPFGLTDAEYVFESNSVSDGWRGFQTAYGERMDIRVLKNTFYDLEVNSISNYFLQSSVMKVSRNHMFDVGGGFWYLNQPWVAEGSRYLVEHNTIELQQHCWTGAVEVWDYTDAKSELVVVSNRIHSVDATAPYGPISLHAAYGSVIAFNKITGNGPAAMYIGAAWDPVDDVVLLGNNVQNFEVTDGIWDFPIWWPFPGDPIEGVGRIWLGELSSNCLVVGGSNKNNVVNEGTDNIVVGVDRIGWWTLGRMVFDAVRQIWEMKMLFR